MNIKVFILFVFIFSYSNIWGKVSIRGKIIGYDGQSKVYYQPTIEGIYTPYWMEVKPSGNGSFKIEFENEGFGNTTISYKRVRYRFFHDENSEIYFELDEIPKGKPQRISGEKIFTFRDSVKQVITRKITGDYEAINQFYNRNLRSSYVTTRMVDGNFYSFLIYKTKTPSEALTVLDSLIQKELDQINKLPLTIDVENPEQEKKAVAIKRQLTDEVETFYNAILLNAMFMKRKEHVTLLLQDSLATPTIYGREWEVLIENLYEHTVKNQKPITSSPEFLDFVESMSYTMADYQRYDFPQDMAKSLDQYVVDKLFNYDTILINDHQSRLSYRLGALQLYLNDQLFYSPILLHAVYELQDQYPESKNLQHYQPLIKKIENSLEVAKSDFGKAKIVEANHSTFSSLIKRFKGQNLLIDVWATWCHPCIDEFKYKSILQPFRENGQLEVLYISIDKKQWDDRWRQSIKINELEGVHFRADPKFISDMWSVIGDFQGAIPRYVLIDKEGQIFKSTAARPGNGTELMEQIESMVDKR